MSLATVLEHLRHPRRQRVAAWGPPANMPGAPQANGRLALAGGWAVAAILKEKL
jgi:hypothetical protein